MIEFSERLASSIAELQGRAPRPTRWLVAFSGGLDSTVLLHALSQLQANATQPHDWPPLLAVHVDHQLQAESPSWSQHCAEIAARLKVDFESIPCNVDIAAGLGPEAAAREARYRVFADKLGDDDWLLCAHHRDDQAETLLLNLMRGSGPDGLASMTDARPFAGGWLMRPLLGFGREELGQYAQRHALRWIDDPSNASTDYDRNFLRHEVLPILDRRWPRSSARIAHSARHAADSAQMLKELASIDLRELRGERGRLPIDRLLELSEARQSNVIRAAVRELGLPLPGRQNVATILSECIAAREDAEPQVRWRGASVRRYRNGLYLLPETLPEPTEQSVHNEGIVRLGEGLGELSFARVPHYGLSPALLGRGLQVRTRCGGEQIKPNGQVHTHKLKKLLQEEGIVPWMRERLPLLYCGTQLVAVGDLWLAADAVEKPGIAVHWIDPPALH